MPSAPAPAAPAPAQPTAAAEPEAQPAQAPKAVASAATVSMRDFSFAPASVTVNVGESVTWVNNGQAPHNAVGDGVSTPLLQSGESDSQTFSSAGTFSYICTIHPQMKGTVTVQASSSGGSGGGSSGGSGTGSTGSGSDAGAAAGTTGSGTSGSSTSSGAALPATGADAWLFAAIGVVMLGFGIALRDRSRTA